MNELSEESTVIRLLGMRLFSINRTVRRDVLARGRQDSSVPPVRPAPAERPVTFLANSMFLHECFRVLTMTPDESLHTVTGSRVWHLRVLERVVPLGLSRQSIGGAEADNGSLAAELMRLHEFGLVALGYFHTHPGLGVSATIPSSTDRRTQDLMEKSGADIVGGIFSRDGFVRIYANCRAPRVCVVGKRIKEVEPDVYHLETSATKIPG